MSDSGRRGKNMIWDYFDKVDDENKEAECKLCHNMFNYRSTSHNLKNHLKHKHNDVFMSIPVTEIPGKIIKMRKNRSSVWEYFEVFDNEKKIASCNECQRTISYRTTTANLKTHLRRVHEQLYVEMEGEEKEVVLEEDGAESDAQDDVWSFFERAGGEARCAVCRALVPIPALRSHLRNNHPKLVDVVESEEETATNNAQEDVYTEVVYLEHEDSPKRAPKPIEKPTKPKQFTERRTKKRKLSSSSDDEPLKYKKKRNDDEIEQFGKYITCLLKKIPQDTSMELQMEIVNLIMKKQLEQRRNETSVLAARESKMAGVETVDGGCQTAFEIKISDEKSLSNGYSYSIEKIVNDETQMIQST
ncbi:uncharacterized protein LOC133531515 isoform X2 [Cydia pomonella]|uniref:uncharacterized protein LOC133531515 isoform X2 n=1 Tax=Cydia pomonella TaxID=82600 RepID=UPI002ADE9103|nr:uncharacterized protein LOC133531515 isoform X2 [Cydia pomonella]